MWAVLKDDGYDMFMIYIFVWCYVWVSISFAVTFR